MSVKFDKSMVTDAKRVARGETLLRCRTLLRKFHRVHHRAWRFLIMAGHNPSEEICAIRSLVPHAHITAVDSDSSAVDKALSSGANSGVTCDALDFVKGTSGRKALPAGLGENRFDAIILDLCCSAITAERVGKYVPGLNPGGILSLTFSYGRDVKEVFTCGPFGSVPAPLGGRVRHLAMRMNKATALDSVIAYQGPSHPMCVCIWNKNPEANPWAWDRIAEDYSFNESIHTFHRVGPSTIRGTFAQPDIDPSLLYATPPQRLAAFKAAYTRATRSKPPVSKTLLDMARKEAAE